jgi:dynein heavy chain
MQTQAVGGGSAGEEYEMVTNLATDILTKVPKPFDVKAVAEQYPVLYTDSISSVLRQVSYQMASCIVIFM